MAAGPEWFAEGPEAEEDSRVIALAGAFAPDGFVGDDRPGQMPTSVFLRAVRLGYGDDTAGAAKGKGEDPGLDRLLTPGAAAVVILSVLEDRSDPEANQRNDDAIEQLGVLAGTGRAAKAAAAMIKLAAAATKKGARRRMYTVGLAGFAKLAISGYRSPGFTEELPPPDEE